MGLTSRRIPASWIKNVNVYTPHYKIFAVIVRVIFRTIVYEVAYFAKDVATGEMIMPYTVTADVMTELTTEISTKISALQITGNLVSLHRNANYYNYFIVFIGSFGAGVYVDLFLA